MATLLIRPADGGSADKKRRARKGKNAQKKQPQRGLGVAQLEKLRLQEQSLLCPTSSSYALRLSATDSDHPMVCCDADVSQTVLSLTTSNVHPQVGGGGSSSSVVRSGEAGTLLRLSALNGHSTQSCLSPHLAHDMNNGNSEAFHTAAKRAVASRALACLSQSKFSSVNASFFSNVLTATQLQILETQAQAQQKVEERRAAAAAGESSGNAAAYIFPSINNYLKEAPGNHVGDESFKLHPVFKDHIGSPTNIARADSTKEHSSFQIYPSQQAFPTAEKVSGRKRPWLALQENSRQSLYAQALDLNAPVEESDAGYSERNPVRPNQVPEFRVGAHYTTGIVRNALGNSSLPLGAKMKLCPSGSHWQENNDGLSHVTACFPDMGLYSETAIGFRHCPSQSSIKDSCSSATGSSSYRCRNRQSTSQKDPDIPSSLVEKESIRSNFLSLGMSRSSYPDHDGWNAPEESIQDNTPTNMHDVRRFRQQESTTSGCEGDNHASQVRKPAICTQEVGGFDLKGDPGRALSLDYDGGGTKRKTSMPLRDFHLASSSHCNERLPSLPPPSIASNSLGHAEKSDIDYDPSSKSTRIVEDILDLRLKLAL